MNTVKIKSYAKVNLTLDVTGRAGGYHLLDSFVASVDLFDLVCVRKRKDKLVSVTMHGMDGEGIPPERNNALKAGEAFVGRFSTAGADVTVYKNIPMGAGLGGSSADAAGVLNAMAKLYGIDDKAALGELADALGSDTRYMLDGGFCRMRGRGEKLTFLPADKKTMHFLLICPKSSVASGECYAEYDRAPLLSSATESCIGAFGRGDIKEAGRYLTNALYPAATRLNSDVEKALKEAQSFFPLGAAMTGSGSGVLALFETKELCDWARSRYRGKFRTYTVSTLVPREKKKIFRSPFVLTDEEREISSFKEE
ncbi:MAG: 4-(cytidine 5'-diphospho)-2-C-methyl-D-erythritol kinase [Coriobacteriales bacterium]|jgi:4-(cytidine 5'-diphospho)-2-C-methyl-D-erythritol kinase